MINLSKDLEATVKLLVSRNQKVKAIKTIKDATGCALKEAKDCADTFDADKQTFVTTPVDIQIDEKLQLLLAQGKKLEAIKLYKDTTYKNLADCKTYIENLEQQAGTQKSHTVPGSKRDTQIDDILNAQKPQSKSGCFIATACYEDYHAPEVWLLRHYRDERLQSSLAGKLFIKLYYAISPAIARQLNKRPKIKVFIKHKVLNWLVNRILH